MIVSVLQGGLGNTIFQITASIGTGEFYGIDLGVRKDWKYRKYFNIPEDRFTEERQHMKYKEPFFHYSLIPFGSYELFGYFQSPKYFNHCEYKIRELFSPKKQYPDMSNVTAIHVRGGDYLRLSEYHYNLQSDYYAQAMNAMGLDNQFAIFSDDAKHAKTMFPEADIISGDEIDDFFLMAQCKNFIIANSSYSWWAAYLGKHPEKKVIAPKNWFGELKKDYITRDLYCENWTVI